MKEISTSWCYSQEAEAEDSEWRPQDHTTFHPSVMTVPQLKGQRCAQASSLPRALRKANTVANPSSFPLSPSAASECFLTLRSRQSQLIGVSAGEEACLSCSFSNPSTTVPLPELGWFVERDTEASTWEQEGLWTSAGVQTICLEIAVLAQTLLPEPMRKRPSP